MKDKLIIIGIIAVLLINLASALTIDSVISSPAEIQPGERVNVELVIENNLGEDVEDVAVSLDLTNVPFAPYQSSSELSIDKIKDDNEEDLSFKLIADSDAKSGNYKLPVKIKYRINSENKEDSGLISLIVNAKPKLDVSVEDSVLIKGKTADLKIKVTNSGLGEAKLLNIKLGNVLGIKMLSTDTVYIGSIDSDDFDTAIFRVIVSETAGSSIGLPLELSYTDSRNEQVKENKNIQARTYTENEAVKLGLVTKSRTATYIIGVIAIIVLYLIYRTIRKRLKKRKLEQEIWKWEKPWISK